MHFQSYAQLAEIGPRRGFTCVCSEIIELVKRSKQVIVSFIIKPISGIGSTLMSAKDTCMK